MTKKLPRPFIDPNADLPATGDLIGYKKVYSKRGADIIVKLLIPATSKRIMGKDRLTFIKNDKLVYEWGINRNRKCRTDVAKVLDVYKVKKKFKDDVNYIIVKRTPVKSGKSHWITSTAYGPDRSTIYRKGKIMKPLRDFDADLRKTCTSGIHFFLTEEQAIDY